MKNLVIVLVDHHLTFGPVEEAEAKRWCDEFNKGGILSDRRNARYRFLTSGELPNVQDLQKQIEK